MKIYLASDHAGFIIKEKLKENLLERGFLVEDFGANSFDQIDDYPDFIYPCVKKYIRDTNGDPTIGVAIVFGGSGTGEAIVANKVRGARAVSLACDNLELVRLARAHNNANVLSIGARFVDVKKVDEAVKVFMSTSFEHGRHAKRVLKIDMLQ